MALKMVSKNFESALLMEEATVVVAMRTTLLYFGNRVICDLALMSMEPASCVKVEKLIWGAVAAWSYVARYRSVETNVPEIAALYFD